MDQNKHQNPPTPSTEEKVQRIIEAGEKARQDAEHQAHDTPGATSARLERIANELDARAGHEPEDIRQSAHHTAQKTREMAYGMRQEEGTTKEKAQATAEEVQSRVQAQAGEIRDRAEEMGARATARSNEAMTRAGQRMEDIAQTLRSKAPSGRTGEATTRAAEALERSGRYLQHSAPNDVRMDLENLIRRKPVESLLVGAGIGVFLARMFRRR